MQDARDQQLDLPLDEAAAAWREDLQTVLLAGCRIGMDAELKLLLEWVYRHTHGGRTGRLVASYKQIAATPWGLCCSEAKARSTVARAAAAGIVAVVENRGATGVQRSNGYQINWVGIRRLMSLATTDEQPPHPAGPGALGEQVPALPEQVPVFPEQVPALPAQANARVTHARSSFNNNYSKPSDVDVVVDETGLDWGEVVKTATATAASAWGDEARNDEDRRFILGVSVLAVAVFGEEWLSGACRNCRRIQIRSSRSRYLRGVLATRCHELLDRCGPGDEAKAFFDRAMTAVRPIVAKHFRRGQPPRSAAVREVLT